MLKMMTAAGLVLYLAGAGLAMPVDNETDDTITDTCGLTAEAIDEIPFTAFLSDGDVDAVRLNIAAGEELSIALGSADGIGLTLAVENSAAADVAPAASANGLFLFDPGASGTTCISLTSADNGSYTLAAMGGARNEFDETTGDFPDFIDDAEPLTDDADVFGRIASGDGGDWFRIESDGATAVSIHGGGVPEVSVQVYGEDFAGPVAPASVINDPAYGPRNVYSLSDGTWYVEVAMSDPGTTGAYYVGIRGNRAASGSTDPLEPDEGVGCAASPGGSVLSLLLILAIPLFVLMRGQASLDLSPRASSRTPSIPFF